MNINQELLEKIRKAKDEQQIPTPKDKPEMSLREWFAYITTTPRTADDKEAKEWNEYLKQKGIID